MISRVHLHMPRLCIKQNGKGKKGLREEWRDASLPIILFDSFEIFGKTVSSKLDIFNFTSKMVLNYWSIQIQLPIICGLDILSVCVLVARSNKNPNLLRLRGFSFPFVFSGSNLVLWRLKRPLQTARKLQGSKSVSAMANFSHQKCKSRIPPSCATPAPSVNKLRKLHLTTDQQPRKMDP